MKRIFIGFTLLLALFLSPLTGLAFFYVGPLYRLQTMLGLPSGILEFILAAVAVALFFKMCRIRDRLALPMPGMRLMTFGVAAYIGIRLISGALFSYAAIATGGADNGLLFLFVIAMAISKLAAPISLLAKCVLVVATFRVLTNLQPSPSWEDG